MDREPLVLLVIGFVSVIVIGVGVYGSVKNDKEQRVQWERFKVAHECHIVAKRQGHTSVTTSVGTGVGANGQVTTTVAPVVVTTPGQTAWECNDGITYWRNN